MECPNCEKDTATLMHEDVFTCGDCDSSITISYCACIDCGYTYRNNNGRFLDGATLEECLAELSATPLVPGADKDLLDEEILKGDGSMTSLIHKCIKCGELAHPISNHALKCSACDFEWEILSGE